MPTAHESPGTLETADPPRGPGRQPRLEADGRPLGYWAKRGRSSGARLVRLSSEKPGKSAKVRRAS